MEKAKGIWLSDPRKRKGNIVFVRKGDHQVALGKELCKLVLQVTCLVVSEQERSLCERNGHQFLEVKKSKTVSIERKLMIE